MPITPLVMMPGVGAASASAYTQSFFQPELFGTSGAVSYSNGTVYFRPFELNCNMAGVRAIVLQNFSSQSLTTFTVSGSISGGSASSGSGSYGQTGTIAFFSRKNTATSAADYSNIVSFSSGTWSMAFGQSISVSWSTNASSASVSWSTKGGLSYIDHIDGSGNVTTTSSTSSGSSTFSSTSTAAQSISSNYTMTLGSLMMSGWRYLEMPLGGGVIPPSEYWLMVALSTTTGSTNYSLNRLGLQLGLGFMHYITSSQPYLEYGNTAGNATSNIRWGIGSYSASSNTTTTIALTQISSLASNASLYFALIGETI